MPELASPPIFWRGPDEEQIRKVSLAVRHIIAGKTNNFFDVTLVADATQTIVIRDRVNIDSKVSLTPSSASAAGALVSLWVEVSFGKITIHHDSDPATDRSFAGTVIG